MSKLEPIGDEVRRELGRFPAAAGMTAIVAAWPAVVGPAIARNAWPARLARDGTLHVAASSSAWAFELTQLRGDVLPRLQEAVAGEASLTALRFAPGRVPTPDGGEATEPTGAAVAAGPQVVAAARELTAGLGDETLRNLVSRAAAASLERARNDRPF
ncbi:MAG: DciA family protein [Gaiellaceae bacterium]